MPLHLLLGLRLPFDAKVRKPSELADQFAHIGLSLRGIDQHLLGPAVGRLHGDRVGRRGWVAPTYLRRIEPVQGRLDRPGARCRDYDALTVDRKSVGEGESGT